MSSDPYVTSNPDTQWCIGNTTSSYNIYFHRDGKEVGKLDFNGVPYFEGDMDESAKAFLDFICSSFAGRLKEEYEKGRKEAINE